VGRNDVPVTVKVNGTANSLVHKGSGHFSAATMPDVCKTPSPGGPVPIPYPNISQSATLANGTTTVKADGGMMIANKGSEFSLSNGDNPGVAGGVKSSTFMKESTWILYSFDVKMDGKNTCRLSDKKFQNHENAVDLAGAAGPPVPIVPGKDPCKGVNCGSVSKKIENIRKEIQKRIGELHEDPQGLPWSLPGAKPHQTREGHVKILNEHKANLAKQAAIYATCCGGDYELLTSF
jgi:hypothetical protein